MQAYTAAAPSGKVHGSQSKASLSVGCSDAEARTVHASCTYNMLLQAPQQFHAAPVKGINCSSCSAEVDWQTYCLHGDAREEETAVGFSQDRFWMNAKYSTVL
jgi:hypothetical protein